MILANVLLSRIDQSAALNELCSSITTHGLLPASARHAQDLLG
jgi:hypothetical protein